MVRDAEKELLPCGVDQGVGALIWSPLASGFLSGKYRHGHEGSGRLEKNGRLDSYDNPHAKSVLDAVFAVAEARGVSASQVALNWLRARPGVTSLLIGARTEAQLRDNLAAADWTLSEEEVATLARASQHPEVYPNSHHRMFAQDRNPQLFAYYETPA